MVKTLTRTHYIILVILSLIPLMMVLAAFQNIPDPMPAHFSSSGEVNRWGSRYEAFLTPALALFTGAIMIWATKYSEKTDDHMGKMMFFVTVVTLSVCILVTAFVLYLVLSYSG
jgi:uncharacterized membrane protein